MEERGQSTQDTILWMVRITAELAMTMMTFWYLTPEHERNRMLLAVTNRMARMVEWTANRSGRYAMSRELAGEPGLARWGYRVAYRLMTGPRSVLSTWYDHARGV